MSAERTKVGMVKPGPGSVPFWKEHAPESVELLARSLEYRVGDRDTFTRGFSRAEELAAELKEEGCELIAVAGTPPSLLAGLDFERQWGQALATKIGVPVVTAMEPHGLALQAIGARRVAVATHYGDELNQAIVRYLARFDVEGLPLGGINVTGQSEPLYSTPMLAVHQVTADQFYEYCSRGVQQLGTGFDALYINGAGWDVPPVIDRLEQELGLPVIWGPVAEMWVVYNKLGLRHTRSDCGALLREHIELPASGET